MKLFDLVTSNVDLKLDDGSYIPAGTHGRIAKIDPQPANVVPPARWFGYAVHFAGFMTTAESYDCARDELENFEG